MILPETPAGHSSMTIRRPLPCGCVLQHRVSADAPGESQEWIKNGAMVLAYWIKKRTEQHRCGTPDK